MSIGLGGPSRRVDDTTYDAWVTAQKASASSLQPMVDPYKTVDRPFIPQTAPHDLPAKLREMWVGGDAEPLEELLAALAATEIECLRMVLGDLTAAKSRTISRWSRATFKASRRLAEIYELREQNRRLIAELLAYRAEDSK